MAFAIVIQQFFAPTVLTGSAVTLGTPVPSSPASSTLQNARIRFTNTDTAIHTVTAYAVPLSGTAGTGNCFLNAESIAPNSHLDVDVPVLAAGGFIQALADSASKITAFSLGGTVMSQ
jgi:hypothetical protein